MTGQQDLKAKKNLTFITGGTRCGKSVLAESMAVDFLHTVYYLATMPVPDNDAELAARIDKHRQRRPQAWRTIESPFNLHTAVCNLPAGPGLVIIDCLSLYVSNLLLDGYQEGMPLCGKEEMIAASIEELSRAIGRRCDLDFVIVSNEVGWGVVPVEPLSRSYRDLLGLSNQFMAGQAGSVYLVVSGMKLKLK